MCPEAEEYLRSAIRCQRLGLLERALAELDAAIVLAEDDDLRARALTWQSNVRRARCEWDAAVAAARRAREVATRAGLGIRTAEAWIAEANVHLARGEFEAALPIFHELLDATDDARLRGVALQNIGNIRAQCGMLRQAEQAFARSFSCFERAGYLLGQAISRINQGRARLDQGDAAGAVPILEGALALAREVEDAELVGRTLVNLAEALLPTDPLRAEDLACTALGHFRTSGSHLSHVECLRLLGDINARRGDVAQASACWVRGQAMARRLDAQVEVATLERRLQGIARAVDDAPPGHGPAPVPGEALPA